MLILQAVAAEEIILESLDNGPGLLPFKLGPTKIISQYHSFLQPIDLNDMASKVSVVKAQLNRIRPQLNNYTQYMYEPHMEHLDSKLNKISEQLQTFTSTRVKRGLVDGLGSVIKSISGNLDFTDAVKYDNAIKVLEDNQQELALQFNHHITLSKEWISEHSKVLDSIVKNQIEITEKVNKLANTSNQAYTNMTYLAHLAQLFLILGDNIEELSDELLRIENLLAFIHTNSPNHLMLNLEALKTMLLRIRSIYNKEETLEISVRDYFDIIKMGFYYSADSIVIVFKIPIFLPSTYDLYKLSIVPNKNKEILIPPSPYIVMHESDLMYIETECPKANTWYICEKKYSLTHRAQADCIQQLIVTQKIDASCKFIPVALNKEATEQLDEKHYTISFPKATKVQTSCARNVYETLRGSFLVVLPMGCYLRTEELTIINTNDRIKGHVVKIIDAPLRDPEHVASLQALLTLNSISLANLHSSNAKIAIQPHASLRKTQDTTLYHTTIPMYIVLLGATALIGYLVTRKYLAKFRANKTKLEANQNGTPETGTPDSRSADNYSELFSTKVLK